MTDALHQAAVAALRAWDPGPGEQDSLRHAFLSYLAARADGCRRSSVPGHLTASMLLLDATGEHAMLTLHPRVGRWLQLGGHCEDGDTSLADAALREGVEESGVDGIVIDRRPLHLAVHPLTCSLGVPTRHLDVRCLGTAPPGAQPRRSAESVDLAWWPVPTLLAGDHPDVAADVATLTAAATARAGAHMAR